MIVCEVCKAEALEVSLGRFLCSTHLREWSQYVRGKHIEMRQVSKYTLEYAPEAWLKVFDKFVIGATKT